MALVSPDMPCSLCSKPIRIGDEYIATTHFIGDSADPLYRYSDSAMHRSCFDNWEHRDIFTSKYHQTMGRTYFWGADRQWPPARGAHLMRAPRPLPPPLPPEFECPQCKHGLYRSRRDECPSCGWLKYPSDRSKLALAGPCPKCEFNYRWDGNRCSHCGWSVESGRQS